jgi:hypothetical protein
MIVKKIIFASDDSDYLKFWKDNSEICKKKLKLEPVLFHITEEDSDFFNDEFGVVKKIKKIPNIPTSLQAQNYRFFGFKFFPDEICMVADIDMFLIDSNYLNKVQNIPDEDFVVMESDAYDIERHETRIWVGNGRYLASYVISQGNTMSKILSLPETFEEYMEVLQKFDWGFATDEHFLAHKIDNQNEIEVHKLRRGWMSNFYCPKRIEKINFSVIDGTFLEVNDSTILDFFIDCHCPIPYENFSEKIELIKNKILNLK